jgi:hypothetical protein
LLSPLLVWCAWKAKGATEVFTRWVKYGRGVVAGLDDGKPGEESGVELPGWHEPADEVEARQGERRKMLLRAVAVAVVVWLVNLVSLPG